MQCWQLSTIQSYPKISASFCSQDIFRIKLFRSPQLHCLCTYPKLLIFLYKANCDVQTLLYSVSFEANGILPPYLHLTSSTGQVHLMPVSNIHFTLKWKSFKMTICCITPAAHLIYTFTHNSIILQMSNTLRSFRWIWTWFLPNIVLIMFVLTNFVSSHRKWHAFH